METRGISIGKSLAFASASHDVRTSLAGISGLIELCRDDVPPQSELDINLIQMNACASKLLEILNSILDMSKVEAGKMQLEEVEFDMNSILDMSKVEAGKMQLEEPTSNAAEKPAARSARLGFEEAAEESERGAKKGKGVAVGSSALDELMKEEEKAKERSNRKDYWLFEGIVVKVMSKTLKEKGYYKQKGVVKRVIDKYVGEIEMLESKHVLRVDQEELETVIPQIGGIVRIVNGAYRGSNARLLSVNTERFCAKVQIEKGIYDGRVLQAVDYEDICKVLQ
ncbi:uncharacterized protein A4U43_C08F34810 [Asparagus officinalis]|nr:uncharacterized protein A4U43_C08F34810 [Asparagus officinalis]